MRQKLTPAFVMNAPTPEKGRIIYWDATQPAFGLRVMSTGHKSFVFQYRAGVGRSGTKRLVTLNCALTLTDARREAKKIAGDVARGGDPVAERRKQQEAAGRTVKAVLEEYLVRECGMTRDAEGNATFADDNEVRSGSQRLDAFERLVYPKIGGTQVDDLKRSAIVKMLDEIADENGPVMADRTLAYLRRGLNWYASRDDDFRSPIVRGMARTKSKERAGKRILADDEIRDIWTVLNPSTPDIDRTDLPECFGRFQRNLFFCAVRRTEAAAMSWPEIDGEAWTIPAARMKAKQDHVVPLTEQALTMIGERPKDAKRRPYVFSTTGGKRPFSGYSKSKSALDREIAALRKREDRPPMAPWKMQQDVRRTARTLMSRAGVPSEIGERVVAHAIPGVEGVYDRYEYLEEKRDALTRLAALIDRIVHPPQDNVVEMTRSGAAAAR